MSRSGEKRSHSPPRYSRGGSGRGFEDSGRFKGRAGPKHMGEMEDIRRLLGTIKVNDDFFFNGSHVDRESLTRDPRLPYPTPERVDNSNSIGAFLGSGTQRTTLQCNHFKVDVSAIPPVLYQYHVLITRLNRDGSDRSKVSTEKDCSRECYMIMKKILHKIGISVDNKVKCEIGASYDGSGTLFTTAPLSFTCASSSQNNNTPLEPGEEFLSSSKFESVVQLEESDIAYRVLVSLSSELHTPTTLEGWKRIDQSILRALDTALYAYPRWETSSDRPSWFIEGTKAYRSDTYHSRLDSAYVALTGYSASLKMTLPGLVVISDMSLSVFLASGELVNLMWTIGGFSSLQDMLREAERPSGINKSALDRITRYLRGCKLKLTHMNHWRKFREFGPPSNSKDTEFMFNDHPVTVAQYFAELAQDPTKIAYRTALSNGRLRYPFLPTVNIGNKQRAVLVPPELVIVPDGQTRNRGVTPDIQGKVVRLATKMPTERCSYVTDSHSVISLVRHDGISGSFGLNKVDPRPISVDATLLPSAVLMYNNRVVDPDLSGSWRSDDCRFLEAPSGSNSNTLLFGVLIVSNSNRPLDNWKDLVSRFISSLESTSCGSGLNLKNGGRPFVSSCDNDQLERNFLEFVHHGAAIVVVMMEDDRHYGRIKLVADNIGVPTQCLKWKNIVSPPRGFHGNIVMKMNVKLGGRNYLLTGRSSSSSSPSIPLSLSWIFKEPTMLMGIDSSHDSDPSKSGSRGRDVNNQSHHAVVASMDRHATQYCAYLSLRNSRTDFAATLEDATTKLCRAFQQRNGGVIPRNIVVYRDGISENQYESVIDKEVAAIKDGLRLVGAMEDYARITVVICQKRHSTRFYFPVGEGYTNPCPGIVVDGRTEHSAVSNRYVEFFLNSHSPIQGTCRPCKYTLIYDEIGFTLPEIEIMTYWTTYLYCRCNRSVSYATPAYYAHWASRRARSLTSGGADDAFLANITENWLNSDKRGMYFV